MIVYQTPTSIQLDAYNHVHFPILWHWKILIWWYYQLRSTCKAPSFYIGVPVQIYDMYICLKMGQNMVLHGYSNSLSSKSQDKTHDWDMC